ncbi:thiamine phosphate synthase [Aurantimonas sp. Leaf443]|uniref:thiamine phosphate synthase n=1 Tax=Aurantimonas sp. Leaf443 TaxID=1736378 RepID=UPI0006F2F810|nr:thiamine phosphate synthase [Aurantimonas sp. Leaf443]KQT84173.1 thiamine-phosphate pyrophosphorylase [Aurantimonas sp. Leaf443]
MVLDPFYLIVPDAETAAALVPEGVKLLQLRAKGMDEARLRAEIRATRDLCAAHGCTLVVNDVWRLAIEEGCDVVHLGQEDLAEADLPAIRAAGLALGLSTHDRAELETALAARPDYVALGPIWETRLKAMAWAPQTPQRLAEWREALAGLPLVAIGGITVERLPEVFAMGADSAAVVTDVTLAPDPRARCRQWLAATRRWARPPA